MPVIGVVGEEKTKPTQHSVQNLMATGLTPDFLVCRSTQARRLRRPTSVPTYHPISHPRLPLDTQRRRLALFCHVPSEHCLGTPAITAAAAARGARLSPPISFPR